MYNRIFGSLGNIQEPVFLEVHPDNFDEVARGLKEAGIRNFPQWPLIHLQGNPHLPKGVIVWMKHPKNIYNPMTSTEPDPSSLPTPNSSPSTSTSSD